MTDMGFMDRTGGGPWAKAKTRKEETSLEGLRMSFLINEATTGVHQAKKCLGEDNGILSEKWVERVAAPLRKAEMVLSEIQRRRLQSDFRFPDGSR